MTTLWMVYAAAVSLALCVAATAAERGLRLAELPARGAWVGALAGSVGLPLAAHLAGPLSLVPILTAGGGGAAGGSNGAAGDGVAELIGAATAAAGGTGGIGGFASGPIAALRDAAASLEGPVLALWLAASVVLGARLAVGWWRLRRRDGRRRERMHGRPVLVSEAEGPALVGPLRSEIVVPGWFPELPPELRELALRHEEAHRRAGDPWLVLGAEVARVLLPWNPGIHWAARRLRRAVELDCDRRLLRAGADPGRYGRLLVAVGERSRGSGIGGAVALTERTSELKRRILMLRSTSESWKPLRMAGAVVGALAAVTLACETPLPPAAEDASTARDEVSAEGSLMAVGDSLRPGSNAPVVVIDGRVQEEPMSLEELNALEIRSVDVMKGPAATEHYGKRGRNGVIRVTTTGGDRSADGALNGELRRRTLVRLAAATDTLRPDTVRLEGTVAAPAPPDVGDAHLVVVDGEILGSDVDLEEKLEELDVAAVEVVKGRAARALYGERAGEGVVRITTKDGGR